MDPLASAGGTVLAPLASQQAVPPPASALPLDDEWPESSFHHVGSQSVSYVSSVQCEVLSRES